MIDPLREFLDEIIRGAVPKSWEVIVYLDRNSIGINNRKAKLGWGLSWGLSDQNLTVACGTSSMTVNLADPNSREQLTQFFTWLTNWKTRTEPPKGLVIERREEQDE